MTASRKPRRMAREPLPQATQSRNSKDDVLANSANGNGSLPKPARVTKLGLLIDMLRQEGGASLNAIVKPTGWLPHTTRAALTGLRKKGHALERFRSGKETHYRIAVEPAVVSIDGGARSSMELRPQFLIRCSAAALPMRCRRRRRAACRLPPAEPSKWWQETACSLPKTCRSA